MPMKHLRRDLLLIMCMSYSDTRRWDVAVRFARISFFTRSSANRYTVDNDISGLFSYLCCTFDVS